MPPKKIKLLDKSIKTKLPIILKQKTKIVLPITKLKSKIIEKIEEPDELEELEEIEGLEEIKELKGNKNIKKDIEEDIEEDIEKDNEYIEEDNKEGNKDLEEKDLEEKDLEEKNLEEKDLEEDIENIKDIEDIEDIEEGNEEKKNKIIHKKNIKPLKISNVQKKNKDTNKSNNEIIDTTENKKIVNQNSKQKKNTILKQTESSFDMFGDDNIDYRTIIMNYDYTKNKTLPKITKYERALIIGKRAKQIEDGANANIKVMDGQSSIEIAEEELRQRVIPFFIKRPNGNTFEYWKPADMEVLMD